MCMHHRASLCLDTCLAVRVAPSTWGLARRASAACYHLLLLAFSAVASPLRLLQLITAYVTN